MRDSRARTLVVWADLEAAPVRDLCRLGRWLRNRRGADIALRAHKAILVLDIGCALGLSPGSYGRRRTW